MFSSRLPSDFAPNAVSQAVREARRRGTPLLDLTETNPTAVGLRYPDLTDLLSDPGNASYCPLPFGAAEARAAVAATCEAGEVGLPPEHLVLTSSTSEAYSLLFKLLCDPGDEVLVPRPSYPLFELLTRLDAVREAAYCLDSGGAWCIDRESVRRALSASTRAILVVSPNNPTGSMLRADDREWLVELASLRGLALISDEVFAGYPLEPRPGSTSLLGEARALTFTLGGLSKSAGLPQMKLAWIAASGPSAMLQEALARLEIIADSYLSVSTPVQNAARRLIETGGSIRSALHARLRRNLVALRAAIGPSSSITLHAPEGGWSAVLRVPAILSEEQMVLMLLAEHSVLVHPGYFFDFTTEAFLVVSLLPEPVVFDEGIARLIGFVTRSSR